MIFLFIFPIIVYIYYFFDSFLLFIFLPIINIHLSFIPHNFLSKQINIINNNYITIPTQQYTQNNYILPSFEVSYSMIDISQIITYYIILFIILYLLPFFIIYIYSIIKTSLFKHEIKKYMFYFIFFFILFFFLLFFYNNYIIYHIFNYFYDNYQEVNFIIFDINFNLQNYFKLYLFIFIFSYIWIIIIIINNLIFYNNKLIIIFSFFFFFFISPFNIYIYLYQILYCIITYFCLFLFYIYKIKINKYY